MALLLALEPHRVDLERGVEQAGGLDGEAEAVARFLVLLGSQGHGEVPAVALAAADDAVGRELLEHAGDAAAVRAIAPGEVRNGEVVRQLAAAPVVRDAHVEAIVVVLRQVERILADLGRLARQEEAVIGPHLDDAAAGQILQCRADRRARYAERLPQARLGQVMAHRQVLIPDVVDDAPDEGDLQGAQLARRVLFPAHASCRRPFSVRL